jgi:hypothetical protein
LNGVLGVVSFFAGAMGLVGVLCLVIVGNDKNCVTFNVTQFLSQQQ